MLRLENCYDADDEGRERCQLYRKLLRAWLTRCGVAASVRDAENNVKWRDKEVEEHHVLAEAFRTGTGH